MDANLPAVSVCPKCNGNMITKGNSLVCLMCDKPPLPKGYVKPPPVSVKSVSTAQLKELGVQSDIQDARKPIKSLKREDTVIPRVSNTAYDALEIMRNLPMPKDEKEFKKIRKIIQLLEKFVGEK